LIESLPERTAHFSEYAVVNVAMSAPLSDQLKPPPHEFDFSPSGPLRLIDNPKVCAAVSIGIPHFLPQDFVGSAHFVVHEFKDTIPITVGHRSENLPPSFIDMQAIESKGHHRRLFTHNSEELILQVHGSPDLKTAD
jgi:hypothetical protein